jgi:hypothetical protein
LKKNNEGFVKSVEDGQKKTDSAFKSMLKGLTGIKDVTTDLNKTGVTVKTKLEGDQQVKAGLDAIKLAGDSLQRGTITITTDLKNGEQVLAGLEGIEGVATRVDGDQVTLTVDLNGGPEAVAQIEAIQTAASGLDGDDINMDVNLRGGAETTAELEAIDVVRAHLDGNDINMDVNVSTGEAIAELTAFQGVAAATKEGLQVLTSAVIGGTTAWPLLAAAIAAVVVLAGPITALATGAAAGLGVLAAAAGVAVGGFALLAGGAVELGKGLTEISDQTTKVDTATTKLAGARQELANAYASGDEAAIAAALKDVKTQTEAVAQETANLQVITDKQGSAIAGLYQQWLTFKAALPGTFDAPAESLARLGTKLLEIGTSALPALKSAAADVGTAFETAFDRLLTSLNTPVEQSAVAKFFDAMPGVVADITTAVGNFGAGLLDVLGQAVAPAQDLFHWLEQISEQFLAWARSDAGQQQIQQFFETAAPIAKQLALSIADIVKSLVNIDPQSVKDAAQALKDIGDFAVTAVGAIRAVSDVFYTMKGAADSVATAAGDAGTAIHDFFTGTSSTASSEAPTITEKIGGIVNKISDLTPAVALTRPIISSFFSGIASDADTSLSETEGSTATAAEDWRTTLPKGAEDARTGAGDAFQGIADDVNTTLTPLRETIATLFEDIKNSVETNLADAKASADTNSAAIQTALQTAWDAISSYTSTKWPEIKQFVVDALTGANKEGGAQADEMNTHVNNAWDLISEHTGITWPDIKGFVVDALTGANKEGSQESDDMQQHVNNAWDLISDHSSTVWPEIQGFAISALQAIANQITGPFKQAINDAITLLGLLESAAHRVTSFLGGSGLTTSGGNTPIHAPSPGPTGGGPGGRPTGQAKGGIDEVQPQGSTGGISDGLSPRVVYGEQKRRVKESYIVWDRPDNVPLLAETAMGMGYGLVKMARGGKTTSGSSTQNIVADGSTNGTSGSGGSGGSGTGGVDPATAAEQWNVVPSPTASDQQPYTDAALGQYGMKSVPMNPSFGDHVNVPEETVSGDIGGQASGGSVPSTWPSLGMTAGTPVSTSAWNKSGPSFARAGGAVAMAAGGTLGGSASSQANPVDYTVVPVNWWDTFLGKDWLGDPAQDWPTLYPPSGWDPSTVFSPPAMGRGGILRNGIRYFQGGGLNQSQIDAGIAAGTSVLGAPYSYLMAGDDGGFDCAGIWNYIEAAVAYGAPQTGKRWGTYDAAAGSAGSFTTPGAVSGGVNIGVDLDGWGPPDGTHMAGDIGGQSFEATTDQGVHQGNDSSAFGTQYNMGSAGDIAQQVGSGQSFDPAANMNQQVADWWNATAPADMTTTQSSVSAPVQNIQKVNNTGTGGKVGSSPSSAGSSGGSSGSEGEDSSGNASAGGSTSSPSGTGSSPSSSSSGSSTSPTSSTTTGTGTGGGGGRKARRRRKRDRKQAKKRRANIRANNRRRNAGTRRILGMAAGGILGMQSGGTLMDGVQNFMTTLPGATLDYLQNLGQQSIGSLGTVGSTPAGTSVNDWVIAGLEAAGLDPTPEAIATLTTLIGQESGGDPSAVSPDGAQGILQLMPETWSQYSVGGDVFDPVANIAASIRYQLARYGALVDTAPYAKGGMTLSPHFGIVGEAGKEAMLPLENKTVMASLRANLGTEDLTASMAVLTERVDHVAERIDYQTDVVPGLTGTAVGGGVDKRLVRSASTRRAVNAGQEVEARRKYMAGR